MKPPFLPAIIAAMILCGCANVHAQNKSASKPTPPAKPECTQSELSGYSSNGIPYKCSTEGKWIEDKQNAQNGRAQPYRDVTSPYDEACAHIYNCTDGKPPRWVPGDSESTLTCDEGFKNCRKVISHWECDKGYELDGSVITWPNGIAQISPERCKAVIK